MFLLRNVNGIFLCGIVIDSTSIGDASSMFGTVPLSGVVKVDCTGSEDHAGQCTITTATTSTPEYAGIQCQPSEFVSNANCKMLYSCCDRIL